MNEINVGVIIIIIMYVLGGISATIGAFLVAAPLGFLTISIFLVTISIVFYRELNQERSN